MGLAKSMMMEYEARGYGSSDKIVCSKCVGNKNLKQFIVDNGIENEVCDFCKNVEICVEIENLSGEIMDGITFEYEKAVNSMGYNGKEGGYIGATTWCTFELLDDLNEEMELAPKVLEELQDIFDDDTWCERDPYGMRDSEKHEYMWNQFSEMVKHKTRYVFFRMPKNDKYDEESEYLILDHIGQAVEELSLIKTIPQGHNFFRGRTHAKNISFHKVEELCSPSEEYAKSNRMSAEGISVFYGADDAATVLAEIDYDAPAATLAAFENLKPLNILNLADTTKYIVPNLFDSKQRHLREASIFLNKLNKDLTREITEMSAIEYIPAQVVAEYFRYLYTFKGTTLDGIAYSSSKHPNGICYVLFFAHAQFIKQNITWKMHTPKYYYKVFELGPEHQYWYTRQP